MKTLLFSALLLTLVFGTVVAANAQKTEQATITVNQQKKFSRSKLKIKFISVEDSRCPTDTNCVWAGNAKVTIKVINRKGESKTFDLNTNLQPQVVKFENYEIKLGEVAPHPKSNIRINANGYNAVFIVNKI